MSREVSFDRSLALLEGTDEDAPGSRLPTRVQRILRDRFSTHPRGLLTSEEVAEQVEAEARQQAEARERICEFRSILRRVAREVLGTEQLEIFKRRMRGDSYQKIAADTGRSAGACRTSMCRDIIPKLRAEVDKRSLR